MDHHHDFGPVVGLFINGDVASFDNDRCRRAQFRASAAHFGMLRDQLEFFEEAVEKRVGRRFIVGRNMAPNVTDLALGAGRQPLVRHRVPLSGLSGIARDRPLQVRRWLCLQHTRA